MVSTHKKKKKTFKKKIKKIKKLSINNNVKGVIDVPISGRKLKGSLETLGKINYHYQKYDNTFQFFDKLLEKDKKLDRILCIPSVGNSWMRSFLKVILDDNKLSTSELMVKNIEPVDPMVSVEKFNHMMRKCRKDL